MTNIIISNIDARNSCKRQDIIALKIWCNGSQKAINEMPYIQSSTTSPPCTYAYICISLPFLSIYQDDTSFENNKNINEERLIIVQETNECVLLS